MTTVASISFRSDKSLSMDVEQVNAIEMAAPVQLEDGSWACELIIRSAHGSVAIQLQSEDLERLMVQEP